MLTMVKEWLALSSMERFISLVDAARQTKKRIKKAA